MPPFAFRGNTAPPRMKGNKGEQGTRGVKPDVPQPRKKCPSSRFVCGYKGDSKRSQIKNDDDEDDDDDDNEDDGDDDGDDDDNDGKEDDFVNGSSDAENEDESKK